MRNKYIVPQIRGIKLDLEGPIALSSGTRITIDKGSAANSQYTEKRENIWENEATDSPFE